MSSTELVKNGNESIEQLNRRLSELKAKSEIAIVDSATLVQSAEAKLEFESYIRSVEAHFEPELAPAEETVARCKLAMSQLISPVKGWLKSLVERQRNYQAEEKRRTEAEARRIREEAILAAARKAEEERKERERQADIARKAREKEIEAQRKAGELKAREADKLRKEAAAEAEREKVRAAQDAVLAAADVPEIKVLPNLPKGAGLPKNQTFYFAEVVNGSAILFAYDEAIRKGDKDRAAFLSRFVMVDEQEVGAFARQTKNCDKATALLPGVKFTSKG